MKPKFSKGPKITGHDQALIEDACDRFFIVRGINPKIFNEFSGPHGSVERFGVEREEATQARFLVKGQK